MRVAVYTRVSTTEQSTEMQRSDIDRFLEYHSLKEVVYYDDKGFSGRNAERPGLSNLLQDARQGKIGMVVIWKFDRLFRNVQHLTTIMQEFQTLGLKFHSIKDNVDLSTHTGKLMMHIMGAFAEFEVETTRERVKSRLKLLKEKGVILGRKRNSDYVKIVRLVEMGKSYTQVSQELGITRSSVQRAVRALKQSAG